MYSLDELMNDREYMRLMKELKAKQNRLESIFATYHGDTPNPELQALEVDIQALKEELYELDQKAGSALSEQDDRAYRDWRNS